MFSDSSHQVASNSFAHLLLPVRTLFACHFYCLNFLRGKRMESVVYPEILLGGVQQIQLRAGDRENGDLGAVAP